MGIAPKYNALNPPPFHLNVNNTPYNGMNNYYNNYTNINNPTSSVNNTTNNRKSILPTMNKNYNQPKTDMINQNSEDSFSLENMYNEQVKKIKKNRSKSKKKNDDENDFTIDIDVINKNKS